MFGLRLSHLFRDTVRDQALCEVFYCVGSVLVLGKEFCGVLAWLLHWAVQVHHSFDSHHETPLADEGWSGAHLRSLHV